MWRKLRFLLPVFLALVILYAGFSWYIASQATRAERKPLQDNPTRLELPFKDVTFSARDGSAILKGWYLTPDNPKGTIVIVHGLDSNRADPDVGYVDIAAGLYRNGFGLLLFDLRGHGESGNGHLSGGLFEQEDVLGAYDWLTGQGSTPGKIGLLGISMGASISLLTAAREPGINGVVADSPFADVRDMIASELPKRTPMPAWLAPAFIPGNSMAARVFYGIDLNRIVPEIIIGNLNYPVLLIHDTGDKRIPSEHSLRLQKAAVDSTLWIVSAGGHVKAFKTFPEEYLQRVAGYFQQRFSDKRPSLP